VIALVEVASVFNNWLATLHRGDLLQEDSLAALALAANVNRVVLL
jgi:hypothetical protein